jgi:Uma2 family endonuclease
MSTAPKSYLTPEQYLEIERKAEFKSEYYQGEMFAMSGARYPHIGIVANAMRELGQQLRRGPCRPLSNDMRVRVTPTGLYTYPDVVVVCGEPQFADDTFDTLLNPTVIIEVLSESTEAYDRGQKFEQYRSLESLAEYMMISSQRVSAELFARQPDGRWLLTARSRLEDSIELQSVGCHLALADLYEKVDFSPPQADTAPVSV